jgi:hypothetical protein
MEYIDLARRVKRWLRKDEQPEGFLFIEGQQPQPIDTTPHLCAWCGSDHPRVFACAQYVNAKMLEANKAP